MTHIHAEGLNDFKAGMVVVGTRKGFHRIAPGRLTIENSERDVGVRLQISGVDLEGKKTSELISLKEEATRTTKEYSYFDKAQVLSNDNRDGAILFYDSSQELITQIDSHEFKTYVCWLPVTENTRIVSWGVGCNGDLEADATYAQLVVYRGFRRFIVDTMTCTQYVGDVSRFLTGESVKKGDLLAVEYLSTGDNNKIRAFIQVMEE